MFLWPLGILIHLSASICYEKDSHMYKEGLGGMCTAPNDENNGDNPDDKNSGDNPDDKKSGDNPDDKNSGDDTGGSGDTAAKRQIHCFPKDIATEHLKFVTEWGKRVKNLEDVQKFMQNDYVTLSRGVTEWLIKTNGSPKECVYKDDQVHEPKISQKDWMARYTKVKLEHPELSKLLEAAQEAFAIDDDYKSFMHRINNPKCEKVCGEKAIPIKFQKPDPKEIKSDLDPIDFYCTKVDGGIVSLDKNVKLKVKEGKCKAFNLGLYFYDVAFDIECHDVKICESGQYARWPKQVVCGEEDKKILSTLDQEECPLYFMVDFSSNPAGFTKINPQYLIREPDCTCPEGEAYPDFYGDWK